MKQASTGEQRGYQGMMKGNPELCPKTDVPRLIRATVDSILGADDHSSLAFCCIGSAAATASLT